MAAEKAGKDGEFPRSMSDLKPGGLEYRQDCGPREPLNKSKCADRRANFSTAEDKKSQQILCVFQDFLAKAGGKLADEMRTGICSEVPIRVSRVPRVDRPGGTVAHEGRRFPGFSYEAGRNTRRGLRQEQRKNSR